LGKNFKDSEFFWEIRGGNLKQGGNASLPLGGWTPLIGSPLYVLLWQRVTIQECVTVIAYLVTGNGAVRIVATRLVTGKGAVVIVTVHLVTGKRAVEIVNAHIVIGNVLKEAYGISDVQRFFDARGQTPI